MESQSTAFTAALGQAKNGRLVFLSGEFGITLIADPSLPDLARGHFTVPAPHVEISDGLLVIHPRHINQAGEGILLPGELGELWLNAAIPWEIEFRGTLTGLNADLRGLQLRSLDVLGSARDLRLDLSRPDGAGFVYISGDARQVSIRRPQETGVCLQVDGGISGLTLDGRRYPRIDGEARLDSLGFENSAERYEISVAGQAREITIDREG
jgi:hypothetical protein